MTVNSTPLPVEKIWENLLSREVAMIQKAYQGLEIDDQNNVLAHLQRMSTEPGWHAEQKRSAEIALKAIHSIDKKQRK